jgi:hypothetical protein
MNKRSKNVSTHLGTSVPTPQPTVRSVTRSGKLVKEWIATVIVRCDSDPTRKQRARDLKRAVKIISENTKGPGVVVLPGGWFDAGRMRASSLYRFSERLVRESLQRAHRNFVVCLGIDGRMNDYAADQMGIALDKTGIRALARKFSPANKSEREHIDLAQNYLAEEDGIKRMFDIDGQNYFICVCYDSFGMKKINDHRGAPRIDVLLNLIHRFNKQDDLSGDVLYARHGLAGASQTWHCPMFGAVVFYRPRIPTSWPSGVYWNPRSAKSTRHWHYKDNLLKPVSVLDSGDMQVRIFTLRKLA